MLSWISCPHLRATVPRRYPTSPSTEMDEALVMVTKKNTFIHVDVIDEPVTSRRRTKSCPGLQRPTAWGSSEVEPT